MNDRIPIYHSALSEYRVPFAGRPHPINGTGYSEFSASVLHFCHIPWNFQKLADLAQPMRSVLAKWIGEILQDQQTKVQICQ